LGAVRIVSEFFFGVKPMETSVKREEQDEIEKILLDFHKDKSGTHPERVERHSHKLTQFYKNELERKKVDTEHKSARTGPTAYLLIGVLTISVSVFLSVIKPVPDWFVLAVQVLGTLPFFAGCFIYIEGEKRNDELHVLKVALIEKEGVE
jgi:hypothetical protein